MRWSSAWQSTAHKGIARARIAANLEQLPGPQLAIVRYTPGHNPLDEWIFNRADIDASKVVWAREGDAATNSELLRYYHARQAWLIEPDTVPATVIPYPALSPAASPPPAPACRVTGLQLAPHTVAGLDTHWLPLSGVQLVPSIILPLDIADFLIAEAGTKDKLEQRGFVVSCRPEHRLQLLRFVHWTDGIDVVRPIALFHQAAAPMTLEELQHGHNFVVDGTRSQPKLEAVGHEIEHIVPRRVLDVLLFVSGTEQSVER